MGLRLPGLHAARLQLLESRKHLGHSDSHGLEERVGLGGGIGCHTSEGGVLEKRAAGLLCKSEAHLQLQQGLCSRGAAGGLLTLVELLLLLLRPPAQPLQFALSAGARPVHLLHVTDLCLVDVHRE